MFLKKGNRNGKDSKSKYFLFHYKRFYSIYG